MKSDFKIKTINIINKLLLISIITASYSCTSLFEKEEVKNYKSRNSSSRINNSEDNSKKNFDYLDKNTNKKTSKSEFETDLSSQDDEEF